MEKTEKKNWDQELTGWKKLLVVCLGVITFGLSWWIIIIIEWFLWKKANK